MNVIGALRGTDPVLRNEYVLYSSHQDANGVRLLVPGDSVLAGADDNASVSVAEFAAARAFVAQRPRRSLLFVHHGAEERGLLGSRYHSAHPVVPLAQIVAVLNGDMIGRNHPDTAALLGAQPPHRSSSELVEMALRANARRREFVIDTLVGPARHTPRDGSSAATTCRTRGWGFRRSCTPPTCTTTTTPRRHPRADRLRQAHPHGAVDVSHGMVRGECAAAAGGGCGVQAGALSGACLTTPPRPTPR